MIILLATAFLKSRFVIQNRDNIQGNYSVIFNFNKVFFFFASLKKVKVLVFLRNF